MHKKYGEEAAELAIKVMKKARKLGITLIWVTVSPTADSIPKDVTRNTSHRAAFAVGDHVANDGLLGTGKHRAGITATTLSPSEDVGTTLTVGFTKNTFELLRTYYVRKDAGTDQVTPVVQRALALREGIAPSAPVVPAGELVDHLADINHVLGEHELMRTQEVLQRLAAHNLREYGGWTFTELRRVLDPHGAVRKVSVMVVDRAKVREALTHRTTDTDTTDAADATEGDAE
jgi:S-DNA-T family DNA segregation ATPase FtsK/SpoIIIE